jgi:hypothetical protein
LDWMLTRGTESVIVDSQRYQSRHRSAQTIE